MTNRSRPFRARRPRLASAAGLALALVAAAAPARAAADCLPGEAQVARVAEVRDARTILLADGRLVRPAAIESFALLGDDAEAADSLLAERLAGLIAGRQVRLGFVSGRPDRYGRHAAFLAGDGGPVQAELARQGAAVALPDGDDAGCMADILAAEAAARAGRAGRWAAVSVKSAEPGAVSPHLGGYVLFEGTVLSVGNRTARTYLNFGRRWSEDVTVVIEAADRERFGGTEALEALAGRRVRVRGFVEERGGPLVVARWPGQIEVMATEGEGNGT
jgi:hypothetical protein